MGKTVIATKRAIAVIRCSGKPQFEKYGPSSQLRDVNDSLRYFPKGPVELYRTIQVQESASGWNRKKWELAIDECLDEYRQGKAQVIIFSRVDRESRFLASSFPKLLEIIKSGMLVYFALEGLWLDPNNPDSFEKYQREVLDAQAYIRVLRRNTTKGKKESAEAGEIPSSFGRYTYWGLRYDKERKQFEHVPEQIVIVRELIKRYLAGESSSAITVDLQRRGIVSATGSEIHRSAVSRVLSHAYVYAGRLTWDGHVILGKIEPIITEHEASIVTKRLKRNKELSYGFGKRKPLTGRVFCGLCGRRYLLDARKGCRCNASDTRNPVRCPAPKIGLTKLTNSVYTAIGTVMMDDEALIQRAAEVRAQWEKETVQVDRRLQEKKERLAIFNQRRRLLSFQHEQGGLTNDEYLCRLKQIEKEQIEFSHELEELSKFASTEEPPRPEVVREVLLGVLSEQDKLACLLLKAIPILGIALTEGQERDKQIGELMEKFDVKVVVYPTDSKEQFTIDVFVNIPIQRLEVCDSVMVSPSP